MTFKGNSLKIKWVKNMKLMCRDCYLKTHSVPQGYKCEMSNEKYRCTVCGKNKFIVVNIYKESLLLNFKKALIEALNNISKNE